MVIPVHAHFRLSVFSLRERLGADRRQRRRRRDRLRIDLHMQDRRLAGSDRPLESRREIGGFFDRFAMTAEMPRP